MKKDTPLAVLRRALLMSVAADPANPGLSEEEARQVLERQGFLEGEVGDAIRQHRLSSRTVRDERLLPEEVDLKHRLLWWTETDWLRSLDAYDYVWREVDLAIRSQGERLARVDRVGLTTRAANEGVSEEAVELAFAVCVLGGYLSEAEGGLYKPKMKRHFETLPSQMLANNGARPYSADKRRLEEDLLRIVRDVVARRGDGRGTHVDPFKAFGDRLGEFGYADYDLWWRQLVSEMQGLNSVAASTSLTVLSFALVEGALTFVCHEAAKRGTEMLPKALFEKSEKEWDVGLLISGAAKGTTPMFDEDLVRRARRLKGLRQRIHAGRYIGAGASRPEMDLRPETAVEARETAERVVRALLDWLGQNPRVAD